MRLVIAILIVLLNSLIVPVHCADTNVLVIPKEYDRAGAIFFVDECLTRGLTNSISIDDLRKWATNTILLYQRRETVLTNTNGAPKPYLSVLAADVPEAIRTMQTRIPSCKSSKPSQKIEGWEKALELYSKAWAVSKEEVENRLRTIGPDSEPPKVGFYRSSQGAIEAVTISWYIYGVTIGPEPFKPDREHEYWYQRKLADGVYLWHGYK